MENQQELERKKIVQAVIANFTLKHQNTPQSQKNSPQYLEEARAIQLSTGMLMNLALEKSEAQSQKVDVSQQPLSVQKCFKEMLDQYYSQYQELKGRVKSNVLGQIPPKEGTRWTCESKKWQNQLIKNFYKLDIYDDSGYGHRVGFCGQIKDNKRTYCCQSCSKIFKNYLKELK